MHLFSDTGVHLENRRASRLFFVFLWLLYALVYMTKNCFSGALVKIVDEGALSLTQASWINASFYFVYAPLQVLGGVFADKYSPEKLISIGLLGSAVANLVIFFNQSFTVILISWIFNAIVQFALWPSVFKIMSSQLVRSDRKGMVFIMSLAISGGLAFAYAIGAVVERWQYNFLISAITLTALAVALVLICRFIDPLLKKDRVEAPEENKSMPDLKIEPHNKWYIFKSSGFFALLLTMFLCSMVNHGAKNYSAIMLKQSYENISPTLANLLAVLIVLTGVVGILIIKFLVFPRIIKYEFVCYLATILLSLPFVVLLLFIKDLPIATAVISLCTINLALAAGETMTFYFNVKFAKYGLNGTAVGLVNAAAALGFALQYCIFGTVAEKSSWTAVIVIWTVLSVIAIIAIILGIRPSIRFSNSLTNSKNQ
jgi:sugar phosphate permease